MKYFVDHKKKKIHQRIHAGDRCGFGETPVDKREFTDSAVYIEKLEKQKMYSICPFCRSIQLIIE